MTKYLVLCVWLLGWQQLLLAQKDVPTDCENRLAEATTAFSKGELETALLLIEPCAKHANRVFSKEDALIAQTMLATLYVELRNPEAARARMKRILHDYPQYQPSQQADKMQLLALRDEFKVFPRLSVELEAGMQQNNIHVIKSYQAGMGTEDIYRLTGVSPDNPDVSLNQDTALHLQRASIGKKYASIPTSSFGASLVYTPFQHVSLVVGVSQMKVDFDVEPQKHYLQPVWNTSTYNWHKWTYTVEEELVYNILHGAIRYDFGDWKQKIRPYIEGGIQYMKLKSAIRTYQQIAYVSPTVSNTDEPDTLDPVLFLGKDVNSDYIWSFCGGAGILFGHKELSYKIGARASISPSNMVNPENRYADYVGVYKFNHLEDDFSLRTISLYAGINYTFRYGVKRPPSAK